MQKSFYTMGSGKAVWNMWVFVFWRSEVFAEDTTKFMRYLFIRPKNVSDLA